MATATEGPHVRRVTGRMVLMCIVGFFAVVAAVNGIMIGAALTTFSGVETGSAYQAGLAFARESAAAEAQDTLHWRVKANVRIANGNTVVDIDARDAAGAPLAGLEAVAVLHHPTDRRSDHTVALSQLAAGHFRGTIDRVVGQWDVMIELSRGGERLFRSRSRVVLQ